MLQSNFACMVADALDDSVSQTLGRLIEALKARRYRFIVPTPETHARIVARPEWRLATNVRGVLGWNLPFRRDLVDDELWGLLREGGLLVETDEGWRSALRVASLGEHLYLHTSFPPEAQSVFFGPDTYRFARFLSAKLGGVRDVAVLVELGAGAGAGAVVAAHEVRADRVILTDINPRALALARVNLERAGVAADFRCGDVLQAVPEFADLIIANPPFIAGGSGRIYSDGGDLHGAQASLEWAVAGAAKLNPGGRMVLYSGVAVIDGVDPLVDALQAALDPAIFDLTYEEIDPDIFGESLELEAYRDVERIAAVGAVITRRTTNVTSAGRR